MNAMPDAVFEAWISFDSPGDKLLAGIGIGESIRLLGFDTMVEKREDLCFLLARRHKEAGW